MKGSPAPQGSAGASLRALSPSRPCSQLLALITTPSGARQAPDGMERGEQRGWRECPHSGTSTRAPLLRPKLLVQPLALPRTGRACSDVQQQQNVQTEAGNIPRMFPMPRMFPRRCLWCRGTSPGHWWHRAGATSRGHTRVPQGCSARGSSCETTQAQRPRSRLPGHPWGSSAVSNTLGEGPEPQIVLRLTRG